MPKKANFIIFIKKRNLFPIFLIFLLFFSNFIIFESNNYFLNNENTFFPHSSSGTHNPLELNGNDEVDAFFALNGTTGLSSANAHTIDGFGVDTCETGYGIKIINSNRFITIKNSAFMSGILNVKNGTGILLKNCGNITIDNCEINENNKGIVLDQCSSITIQESDIIDNTESGIWTVHSDNNIISQNNISLNGEKGLLLERSNNCTISDNIFIGNGETCIYELQCFNNIYNNNGDCEVESLFNPFENIPFLGWIFIIGGIIGIIWLSIKRIKRY